MSSIHQAIELIKQGRKKDAQSILSELIRTNPHDVKSWFWYAETLNSAAQRIELLEACRKQNPNDPKVLKALEMLRNNQTLNPPSMPLNPSSQPLNRPSQPVNPRTQPPPASSPTPTTPRSDYYSPYPIKYEDDAEKINPLTGLPDPAVSYESPRRGQPIGIPNIHVPMNDQVLDYLKSVVPYLSEIQRLNTGAINHDRTHSDFSDIFVSKASGLPEDSKYIIYGFPALVHPKTGIIFGYAMGMGNKYRLPEMFAREYKEYLDRKNAKQRKNKNQSNKAVPSTPLPLEDNWMDGIDFSESFIQKCYDYYSVYPNTNAVIHFNEADDIQKSVEAPQKPKRSVFGYFLIFLVIALVCLVVGVAVFMLAAYFQYDLSSIINSILSGN